MWHLASESTPTGTAEGIARDLDAWPADTDFPCRRHQGGLQVVPTAEGFSLAATLLQRPNKSPCPFLQTGTARPPRQTQDGSGTQRRHNRCGTPGSPHFGTCPRMPWPMPRRPSKGPSRRPSPPAQPCSAACRRERPGLGGERTDARARTYPWCKGRHCFTPRT